ncbi:hypothetical protein [Streptomyces sp. UNOB3_S3]|uniref:hypothetical protein n=1 Tax=Streptomyces sp. UNOB3_S3 TaxID=2871682 RepID=UPI001E3EBD24|nr:hypothetical protein [Streptomyces sp. UNOB3_S3]MCC3776998.1 hypothetical protein [Streptomyces sp. UNOB3_S3]
MSDDNKLNPPIAATPQDDHASSEPMKARLSAVPTAEALMADGPLTPADDHASTPKPYVLNDDHASSPTPFVLQDDHASGTKP